MSMRWSGSLLLLAGLLFGTFMFFHPPNNPVGAQDPVWAPVHVAWLVSYLLMLFGLQGLQPMLRAAAGRFGVLAWTLALLSVALSLPIAAWDAFIVPFLAVHAPDLIVQVEETSPELPVVTFRMLFFLTVITFSVGFVLLGVALRRLSTPLRGAALPLALGAPVFWAGAVIFSEGPAGNAVTLVGAVLFGAGLARLGYALSSASP